MFANSGDATPPCGVPLVVSVNTLLSSTPAWSHAFTRRFRVGNVLSLRRRLAGRCGRTILHVDASFKNPDDMPEEQHRSPPSWRERTAYRHIIHDSFCIPIGY